MGPQNPWRNEQRRSSRYELSQLIDKLNDRFGTDFKPADQLFFDQVTEAAIENETLKTAAEVNTLDNFRHAPLASARPQTIIGQNGVMARGDSVAILNRQKAALTSGFLVFGCNNSHLFGCGDRI